MFIAVDDTDSRDGMCTTFLATELISEFNDYDLIDYPRLVRLNPNVPWKTRGNGAIVLHLGNGGKKKHKIGEIEDDIWIYEKGGDLPVDETDLERAKSVIERWAELQHENTNPGIVIGGDRPSRDIYDKGVKRVIEQKEVLNILEDSGEDFLYEGYGQGRGLIGAACASAWCPEDFTYEMITYREEKRWGTERDISKEDVIEFDRKTEKTFDNYDHQEEEQEIAPNSPCPVLYGIRGDDAGELQKAHQVIDGEEPERWITFLTNQATDDHIQSLKIAEVEPWISVRVHGKVSTEPKMLEGGHLFFDVQDEGHTITAAAYEPTKDFRNIVKKLIPGDKVELWGGIRKDPITLNIEKMKVHELAEKEVKVGNPVCPGCGKRMSSIGKDAGFRCKRCSEKAAEDGIETKIVDRDIEEDWYETPVTARRHLSKPLQRIKSDKKTKFEEDEE